MCSEISAAQVKRFSFIVMGDCEGSRSAEWHWLHVHGLAFFFNSEVTIGAT